MIPNAMKPHHFQTDPYSNAQNCRCGYSEQWRYHQPLWWRCIHPGQRWRQVTA